MRKAAVLLLALGCGGAAPAHIGNGPAPAAPRPVIGRLLPDSGPAGMAYPVETLIEGTGFADSGNVVTFASVRSMPLRALDHGTRIRFVVPKGAASPGEVPPPPFPPGSYPITVTTAHGTSAPATFVLTDRGGE